MITCGALAHEVSALIAKNNWDADILGIDAVLHVFPDRIAAAVERLIIENREKYAQLVVVYGDCGTGGALDRVLAHHGVTRISAPHCYEMFGGNAFTRAMQDEPGTFFLTDYMVRTFDGMIIKSMGLDRHPELRDEYFRNYKQILYFSQVQDVALQEKAAAIADYLRLPLQTQHTGYNVLETRLATLMETSLSQPKRLAPALTHTQRAPRTLRISRKRTRPTRSRRY